MPCIISYQLTMHLSCYMNKLLIIFEIIVCSRKNWRVSRLKYIRNLKLMQNKLFLMYKYASCNICSPCFEINSQILIMKIFQKPQHKRSCISYSYEAYYMTSGIMHKFGSQKHVYISLDLRATLRRLKLLQSTFVESCDIACFQRQRK